MFGMQVDWVCPHRENRTEVQAPYSFSEHFLWRGNSVQPAGPNDIHAVCEAGVHGVYSDRLAQADYDKFEAAMKACGGLGQYPDRNTVTTFLNAYYGKPMIAHALARGCNVGNGYPYWIIWFSEEGQKSVDDV